jgi:hypothetical protein
MGIEPGNPLTGRSWGRLHQKGYISDPVNKAKSVLFTEEGARESQRLLEVLFAQTAEGT